MSSKQPKKLSIEKLREYSGFENITDEEAKEAIDAIEKCARLFFSLFQSSKTHTNEKQST